MEILGGIGDVEFGADSGDGNPSDVQKGLLSSLEICPPNCG
jgi:hypothetical protein